MPTWVGAEDLMRRLNDRRAYLEAVQVLEDDDVRWVDAQLDIAFEGRMDYVRDGVHFAT